MSELEENHKRAHLFYRIMELPEKELKSKIATMSREEIVNWLRWNDPMVFIQTMTHSVNLEISCPGWKGKS